jgi:hypothetical protein
MADVDWAKLELDVASFEPNEFPLAGSDHGEEFYDILVCAEVNVAAICQRIRGGITHEESYV